MTLIPRETYLSQLRPFMGAGIVKVLTGVRRAGKSTILELVRRELRQRGETENSFVSVNFESLAAAPLASVDALYAYLAKEVASRAMTHVFLDELQEVSGWERVVNSLQADFPDAVDIYVTGSNAKMLSDELATLLSGRYVELTVFPLGFAEYLELRRTVDADVRTRDAFAQYLRTGGMPALREVGFDEGASLRYLSSLYDTILLRDIVRRHEVRDVRRLDDLMKYVVANVGHTFSANGISRTYQGRNLKVAPSTVETYLRYGIEAHLLSRAVREDTMRRQVLTTQEKYYLTDQGFRHALYGHNDNNIDMTLENVVYMELLRRGYAVRVGAVHGKEVDFIAERRGERAYFQVCYLMESDETRRREFGAFAGLSDNWPKTVLSLDEFTAGRDGIRHEHLMDWLLGRS